MQEPLQITFRGVPHSDAVEQNVKEKAAKLEQYFDRIISCQVVIEAEHHHKHQGNLFHVRIDLKVPNKDLVVSREHHKNHAHEDVYVSIRDGFNAAKRQLEDYSRIKRGDTKKHLDESSDL